MPDRQMAISEYANADKKSAATKQSRLTVRLDSALEISIVHTEKNPKLRHWARS